MIQTATKVPVFEIIQLDCAAQVETVIGRARSRAEADRVVAELAASGRPSTMVFWIARGARA